MGCGCLRLERLAVGEELASQSVGTEVDARLLEQRLVVEADVELGLQRHYVGALARVEVRSLPLQALHLGEVAAGTLPFRFTRSLAYLRS